LARFAQPSTHLNAVPSSIINDIFVMHELLILATAVAKEMRAVSAADQSLCYQCNKSDIAGVSLNAVTSDER